MFQDVRYAFRILLKNPGFTSVAVLSLAIGIGANSAIFSLADALMLRPLPVLRPSEVVTVRGKTPSDPYGAMSYRDYLDFRNDTKTFDGLVAYTLEGFGFSPRPEVLPQLKYGFLVTGNFFQVMGVQPDLGRGFRPDEDQAPGRDAVVVLSHDLWEKQFGGDPSIIGRTIRLNGIDFTVVGVAPERFTGMDQYFRPELYVPMAMSPRLASTPAQNVLEDRGNRALTVKGRLKPGVSMAQAQAELQTIAKRLERAYPDTNRDRSVVVRTELQSRVEQSPPDAELVAMLMGLVILVLLVACANVANLLLSRARARSREMAVRVAIGAGRGRLVRQLLTESLFIALAGGAIGMAVAYAGVRFLNQIQVPTDLPLVIHLQLDHRVLLFSLAAAVASALLFGLAPAIQAARIDLVSALKSSDADSRGQKRLWGRNLLVIGQVAFSVVLLTVTAMMVRGVRAMLTGGVGFRHDHLLMMSFDPTLVRYTSAQTQQFYKQLVERAEPLPGVKSVALSNTIPMAPNQGGDNIIPEGYQLPKDKESIPVFSSTVDPHYFDTMAIPIVRGRSFRVTDDSSAPRVAVVNEELARRYWPGQDPIGKRFRLNNAKGPWVQVVGVAKMAKYLWIAEPPMPFLYLPLTQNPKQRMTLLAESVGSAASLVTPLREVVRHLDASQPICDVRTMEDFYDMRAVRTPEMIVQTVGAMGLMGLVLAMVGLYGLVAYSVSRRTREIGIRMAIGADRTSVLGMVLRQGLVLGSSGVAIGFVLSLAAGRVVEAIFNGAGADWPSYLAASFGLLATTLAAAYLPAQRASQIDPMRALRYE